MTRAKITELKNIFPPQGIFEMLEDIHKNWIKLKEERNSANFSRWSLRKFFRTRKEKKERKEKSGKFSILYLKSFVAWFTCLRRCSRQQEDSSLSFRHCINVFSERLQRWGPASLFTKPSEPAVAYTGILECLCTALYACKCTRRDA